MAKETFGDERASSSLSIEYCNRLLELKQDELKVVWVHDELLKFNETEKSEQFFRVFDNACRRYFAKVVVNMNDHNQGIIPMSMFDGYIDLAEHASPRLWKHLCNIRSVTGNRHVKNSQLQPLKKQQVLLQIFVLKRMRNPKALMWSFMIQTIAYYG